MSRNFKLSEDVLDRIPPIPPRRPDGRPGRMPLGAAAQKPHARPPRIEGLFGDVASRLRAFAEPGHAGGNRGLGIARESRTLPGLPRRGIPGQVRTIDQLFLSMRILRARSRKGSHILVSRNTSGLNVAGRRDLDEFEQAVIAGDVEHGLAYDEGRFMRNSRADTFRYIAMLADHRIKIHVMSRSYNLSHRDDRLEFTRKVFEQEEEAERIFLRMLQGLITLLTEGAGQFAGGSAVFGTAIHVARHRRRELRWLQGMPTRIRAAWRRLLRANPRTADEAHAYVEWAAAWFRIRQSRAVRAERVLDILTDPTYEGFYHLHRRWFSTYRGHLDITGGIDLPRVHLLVGRARRLLAKAVRPADRGVLSIEIAASRAGARLERFIENGNLLLVCRRPSCRRAALRRVDRGGLASSRDRVIAAEGVFYHRYICPSCRDLIWIGGQADAVALGRGYRCGWCGTAADWKVEEVAGLPGLGQRPGPLYRLTCGTCGDIQFKKRSRWPNQRLFTEPPRRPFSATKETDVAIAQRQLRVARLHRRGRLDAEIAEILQTSIGIVRHIRRRLGLPGHRPGRMTFSRAAATRLHRKGLTDAEKARALGVSISAVHQWRSKVARLPVIRQARQTAPLAVVGRLRRQGYSGHEIAGKLGLAVRPVEEALRRLGLGSRRLRWSLSPRDVATAHRLLGAGAASRDVARLLGISESLLRAVRRADANAPHGPRRRPARGIRRARDYGPSQGGSTRHA